MNVRHLLIACIVSAVLASCEEGSHGRSDTGSPSPLPATSSRDVPDAASTASETQNPVVTIIPPPPPTRSVRDAGAREEIDNTIYWDAATKPTADNVRGVDAGEPDR
jgi:hypothetical protein